MKLKYYLRGLGIGIVVTAFIMSSVKETEKLTDAQIKMRALELGMIEETVLADLPQAAEEEETLPEESFKEEERFDYTAGEADILAQEESRETIAGEDAEEVENDAAVEATDSQDMVNISEGEDKKNLTNIGEMDAVGTDETSEEQNTVQSNPSEIVESYIVIPVEPGNGSETVSRRLYNAGLVESAVEFNRFLVDNGYDRSLVVGNHEIPAGASEEDMAKILCGLQ